MEDQNLDKNTNLDNIVLALLFAADEPLSLRRMSAILEDVSADDIRESIESWRRRLDDEAWSIAVEQVAGGYQVITRPDYAPFVGRLYSKKRKLRLSRAGLQTLAIIAYRQPVTRADIEAVRGVSTGSVIANLMERSLIKITGKARVLGAPFLYGTTPEFLEYLGLNSLKDLPSLEELEALLEKEANPESALDGGEAEAEAPVPATPRLDEEDADELYEATAAEVAAAMAAVNEARRSVPEPEGAKDQEDDGDAAPAGGDGGQPGGGTSGAARLGPSVEEPVNRPLESDAASGRDDDDAESSDNTEDSVDERGDER